MLLKIMPESETPIYMQLRNQIVAGVATGELSPGDPLPSVRELARDIGVNYHTVNKAYTLLRDEGYVNVYGRRGAVVCKPPEVDEAFIKYIETILLKLMSEAKSKGMEPNEVVRLAESLSKNDDNKEKNGGKK